MAEQVSFDWGAFNDSLAGERDVWRKKREERDARDAEAIDKAVGGVERTAKAAGAQQAVREAQATPLGFQTDFTQSHGADLAPGMVKAGPVGTDPQPWELGTGLRPLEAGEDDIDPAASGAGQWLEGEFKRRQKLDALFDGVSAPWEYGSFSPGTRQKGEKASPWDSVRERLGLAMEAGDEARLEAAASIEELNTMAQEELASLDEEEARYADVPTTVATLKGEYDDLLKKAMAAFQWAPGDPYDDATPMAPGDPDAAPWWEQFGVGPDVVKKYFTADGADYAGFAADVFLRTRGFDPRKGGWSTYAAKIYEQKKKALTARRAELVRNYNAKVNTLNSDMAPPAQPHYDNYTAPSAGYWEL